MSAPVIESVSVTEARTPFDAVLAGSAAQAVDHGVAQSDLTERIAAVARIKVGGLPVAVLDRDETARLTIEAALSRRGAGLPPLLFTTVNGQVASLCSSRPEVRALYDQADLVSADGMSAVIASKYLCPAVLPERVATTDAFHDAAVRAMEHGVKFFLFGATEAANAAAVARARALYPDLEIVGRRNGYFSAHEEEAVVDDILAHKPDILWIGLGVPKQQEFAIRHRQRLSGLPLIKTCGGLFDFLSGMNKRAPRWMQSSGLEWLHRAASEPKRLGWRYLTTNPHAMYVFLTRSGAYRPG